MAKRWLLFLVVAAAAGAGAYYYWQQQSQTPLDIQTVAVKRGDVRRVVATSGTVRALITVEIGSQLSGKISELNVDFSSQVKQGQVLARIEPSTFETRVREEEAGMLIAKANVDLQQAGVERAEANLHKAELDLHRAQELVAKGATSQSILDTALAAQQSGAADVAIAKAQVENAKATLQQRQATLDSTRIDLERTFIRSPIDGVVIERTVEAGQTVAASLSAPKLFTIANDLSKVQIEAQVDEADIGQVTSADPVTFTVDAYPEEKFDGKVEQIRLAPVSLQNVVTYTVVIAADNPAGHLLPGMTANVEIVSGEHRDALVVPNEALRFQPRGQAEALVRDTTETGSGQTGSASSDRTARLLDKLKLDLGLAPEEVEQVRAGVQAEFNAIKGAAPAGAPMSQDDAREQARMRVSKVLRTVLSPEQYKKYEELQRAGSAESRMATVWTHEDGGLVPHRVHLGLADANVTEVTEGLKEGDAVVLRVREITP
jgi:HlyD family secretion protein